MLDYLLFLSLSNTNIYIYIYIYIYISNFFLKGFLNSTKNLKTTFLFYFCMENWNFWSNFDSEVFLPVKSAFFSLFLRKKVLKTPFLDFWRSSWTLKKIWRPLFCFTFSRRIHMFYSTFALRSFSMLKIQFLIFWIQFLARK